MLRTATLFTIALLGAVGAAQVRHANVAPRQGTAAAAAPALVVLISVDQMRADYLDRFAREWRGGFRIVLESAALFPNGEQDHAITETAPGHATMLSGREPARTGAWSNDRGVPDSASPVIGVPGIVGASPYRFVGTTLVDWMRAADPGTRVLSVSRKDRGAILTVGRAKTDVYWFAGGKFTTSTYYRDTLPGWVTQFNRETHGESVPAAWQLLRPAMQYTEPDSMQFEHGGSDIAFPHKLAADPAQRLIALEDVPWMDSLTFAFALRGVRVLGLGARGGTDLLSVSLSTTDKVGHAYGPDSREVHDQLLRLDQWLGEFIDSLYTLVPRERTLIVLTGDHGIGSMPEYLVAVKHQSAGRIDVRAMIAGNQALAFDNGLIIADTTALRVRGVDPQSLADSLARTLGKAYGVAKVYTPLTLAAAPATDIAAHRWRNNIPPSVAWLVAAVAKPGFVFSNTVLAEHGTMSDETVAVPIAFMGPGVQPGRFMRPVRTVDIAPTLAALLGLTPAERLDGVPIDELVCEHCKSARFH